MNVEWANVRKLTRVIVSVFILIALTVWVHFDEGVQAQRPTLPPTWTPTFTPTATLVPTATQTPTPTPTIDPDVYCDTGFFVQPPEQGASIPYDSNYSAVIGSDALDTQLVVSVLHRLSGEGRVVTMPQPGYIGFELPVRLLPRPGLYDWRISLVDLDENVICESTGYVFVGREEWLEPSETPAPTQTPAVIVVTATPTPTGDVPVITATPLGSIRQRGVATVAATVIVPGN